MEKETFDKIFEDIATIGKVQNTLLKLLERYKEEINVPEILVRRTSNVKKHISTLLQGYLRIVVIHLSKSDIEKNC